MEQLSITPNARRTWVKQYNPEKQTYEKRDVAFLELDPAKPAHFSAIEALRYVWNTKFNREIFEHAFEESLNRTDRKYYILTNQTDSFEKLDADKILGIAETSEKGDVDRIEYLQANPKYLKKEPNLITRLLSSIGKKKEEKPREFTDIGSAMVDLIQVVRNRAADLFSVPQARNFYERKGFICPDPVGNPNYYYREKNSGQNLRLDV